MNTKKAVDTATLSQQIDFNALMKLSGDRKRLYSVTHAPNKDGMIRVMSLDQGEVRIVHKSSVKNLQRLCKGKAAEFFDKFEQLFNEAKLVVPNKDERVYSPTFNAVCLKAIEEINKESDDLIDNFNSELLVNYFFYINQLLAMSKKEDKSNDTIQLENE